MTKIAFLACVMALGGCASGLAPPFPDVAPLSKAVLSSEQQQKAIKELEAAKVEQAAAASQPSKVAQH